MPNYPQITSKKIKYDSPSGYALVGKYIPPFEKNDTGFGFKGVVLEDFKSGKILCCICGGWFEQMGSHLKSKHQIDGIEYNQ